MDDETAKQQSTIATLSTLTPEQQIVGQAIDKATNNKEVHRFYNEAEAQRKELQSKV
ncbi:hypothetical protein [Dolosigranulum pigrum]|uniref:hypothetical protein n=1 Tax=Dolosigranulum pigrum TaxID=29394 RepID=UPI00163D8632|nr:hypothetical protein [Dolosigranulum pigrum]